MKKHSIGTRFMSLLLVTAMVIAMVPVLRLEAKAITTSSGVNLDYNKTITMPVKIMDFEADGMLFDYLMGRSIKYSPADYIPETNYWTDYTGTLTSGTLSDSAGRNVRYGSGMNGDSLSTTGGAYGGNQWLNITKSSLGGKQLMRIENVKESATGVPTQWKIADFGSTKAKLADIRYAAVIFRGYGYGLDDPKIGISYYLTEDTAKRYKDGYFSGWYHLNSTGRLNVCGDRNVDIAIIDLSKISAPSEIDTLYLDFPMNTQPDANGNLFVGDDKNGQKFDLVAVGFFANEGDAHQFGYWASSVGAASDTDTYNDVNGNTVTLPKENYDNHNRGFSFLVANQGPYEDVASISNWLASRVSAGQRPLFISGTKDLSTGSANGFGGGYSTDQNIATSIGYTLFQQIGKSGYNTAGYATVGLLESSLDEDGLPVYKESTLYYLATLLKNRLRDCYEYDLDGWRQYTTVAGTPNGELFGYGPGGMNDKGVPLDFATALCNQLGMERRAQDKQADDQSNDAKHNRGVGATGSYEATMRKREYLQGSWLECKQYITTWYDAAYFMLHNLWRPNTYNVLQSDYNYIKLPYDKTSGTYIFDSAFTKNTSGTTSVTYSKTNKTISLTGVTNKMYYGSYEAYNAFTPVHVNSKAGESNTPYYMDDGVNKNSAYEALTYDKHNYGYTIASNGEFTFKEGLEFTFEGDDDVYLFINGELVMDLGATHNNTYSIIYLDEYVSWAKNVLKNRDEYTLAEVARAEKLNLQVDQNYSFDFFYMERHGTGANLRIQTNINVVVPELEVNKVASQGGVEVPDQGVVDHNSPIEYGFSLTNDNDTSKLYNITFTDNNIGVKMDPTNGLTVTGPRTTDKDGGTLDVTDLVAYVDGYDGDPSRRGTKKLDTIEVRFANDTEFKNFLKNLAADGTQSGVSTGLYEGDGLWAFATVTIRGVYYTMSVTEKGNKHFTNTVTGTATNGQYTLSGDDDHTVYKLGEPAYFQWAGHELIIDNEKLYEDLANSGIYSAADLPPLGHMVLTLSDASGFAKDYEHVSNSPGGDAYLSVSYPEAGLHTIYLNIQDKTGKVADLLVAVLIYTVDVKDSAVVLDYGLTADLSSGDGLYSGDGDVVKHAGKETYNTVMGIAGADANADYVNEIVDAVKDADGNITDNSKNLGANANTENNITALDGATHTAFSGQFDSPIYLQHDKPWVIEWKTKGSHSGGLLFSMNSVSKTEGNIYLYTRNHEPTAAQIAAGTKEVDFIALGQFTNNYYDNVGVNVTEKGLDMSDAHTYRLVNMVYTDGTNKVHLYIDGTDCGEMNHYWMNTTDQNKTNNFVKNRDFTFNYVGPEGHTVNLTNYEYIKIWEDGLSLNNYRWEWDADYDNGTGLPKGKPVAVATGETGNVLNPTGWASSGSEKDTDGMYGRMNQWVQLHYDREWAIEFEYSGLDMADHANNVDNSNEEVMLLSSTGTTEHEYLYLRADIGLVSFGTSDAAGYHNYGIAMKLLDPDFDTSAKHVYRLENRLNGDGTCMVYLIVDGTEIGPMDNYFSSGTAVLGGKGDIFTGNNFMFTHIGHKSEHWPVDGTLHYLHIWEDTALTSSYCWTKQGNYLADASVRDTNGNRIDFTSDADGKIEGSDGYFQLTGNNLTFTPTDFMDDENNKAMIAVTVHDRGFIPTPLASKCVDIANEVQMYKTVTVLPATVVYYEDDFVAMKYVTDNTKNTFTQITGTGNGSADLTQNADQGTNYGSDDAYNDSTENFSGNSLYKIKISKDRAQGTGDPYAMPVAYFDFTGTGFEIVSRTNANETGLVYIEVYKTSDIAWKNNKLDVNTSGRAVVKDGATRVAYIPVITEYDNNKDNGAEQVYQVPLVRKDGFTKDEYTAIIYGVPSALVERDSDGNIIRDDNGNIQKSYYDTYLYIDGIRIYQPLGATNENYREEESGAKVVELRTQILQGNIAAAERDNATAKLSTGLTTWTENSINQGVDGTEYKGQEVSSVNDYLVLGPNNEVYMDGTFTSSAIIMLVRETSAATHDLQIGIRAMDYGVFVGAGHIFEGVKIQYSVKNGDAYQWKDLAVIRDGTEQYYTVPYSECPTVGDYRQVAIRVTELYEDVPALACFSNLKYNGLELGSMGTAFVEGVASVPAANVLALAGQQIKSVDEYSGNESQPGEDFEQEETTPENAPTLTPKYPTLSFDGEIRYNIYFTAENLGEFTTTDMGLITFDSKLMDGTIEDALEVIPGAVKNGEEYMVHTNGIPAKKLADTVYFKVYAKLADGSYVYSSLNGYSGLAYAKDRLANSNSQKMKALVVAMLNYGAAAQQYFEYNTHALMNADLTDEQIALVNAYDVSMVDSLRSVDDAKAGGFAATSGGYTRGYPSVSFEGTFAVNYYFEPAQTVDGQITLYYWTDAAFSAADVLTAENASGSITMKSVSGGEYWAAIDGIVAKQINKPIYVAGIYESNGTTYSTGVIPYSVGAYCADRATNGSGDMQTLASATAVYGYYAENYFAE